MTPDQFAERVKAKYPDYRDVPNDQLARKMVEKYPDYAGQVDFGAPQAPAPVPSVTERLVAGFAERPIENPPGLDVGDVAEFIGGEGPAVVGGMIGSVAGPLGSAVGASAGKATQKAIGQAINLYKSGFSPVQEPLDVVRDVGVAGATQGVFESAALAGKAALRAVRPAAVKAGAQAMKTGSGVMEDIGRQALNDPGILLRAASVDDAGKALGSLVEGKGLKTGSAAFKEVFGRHTLTDDLAVDAAEMVADKIAKGTLTPQEAIAARQAISNTLRAPKYLNPKSGMNKRFLLEQLEAADNLLEPVIPGYEAARTAYREAMVKEAFSSLGPQNANKTAAVLRGMTAAGGFEYGRRSDSPLIQAASLALVSPLATGGTLRAAYLASKAGSTAAATQLPEFFARGGANRLAEHYQRAPSR